MTAPASSAAVIDDLKARGLFYQCTDEEGLRDHLRAPRALYNGFDPTADSLTIGNLVPIRILRRFQTFGHTPVVLLGGATGRIGDPSGKDTERSLMTEATIETNIEAQRQIFMRLLDFDAKAANPARLVNNDDWFQRMDVYTFLRDVGKHFSVNAMLARDSVKNRLQREGQGISYTEFSYMLLQAYDFLHLFREQGITLQTAGADQWGNIVSGTDLIRRLESKDGESGGREAFGMTAPLLTKADGGKFGKTEGGAIWLSTTADRPSGASGTSPYAYAQFWLNTSDDDVEKFLKMFTDIPVDDANAAQLAAVGAPIGPADDEHRTVAEVMAAHAGEPHRRIAQRILMRHATADLHGSAATEQAERAASALFSGDVATLDLETLEDVFSAIAATDHSKADLAAGGVPLVELLARTSICKSKREAREFLGKGAVSINGDKVGPDDALTEGRLLHGTLALIRRGKKAWHVTRWK